MARHDDERELEELLRYAGAAVMLVIFALIALTVVLSPGERGEDTTLLLGLASMALGGFAAFVGVKLRLWRGGGDDEDA